MRYKKNIVFIHDEKEHFLFQVINFGGKSDELKFNFNDPKFNKYVIHNRNTGILDKDDVIHKYGELTYHSDGSFLFKFPKYPVKERIYNNPHGVGSRRKPLNEILSSEPIFHYEIFKYNSCRRRKAIEGKDKFIIQNDLFFDGKPFGCVIFLIHRSFLEYPTHNSKDSIYLRLKGITENLDLAFALGKLRIKGHNIYNKELDRYIFCDNNYLRVVENNE